MPKEGPVMVGQYSQHLNRRLVYKRFKREACKLGFPWLTLKSFRKLAATWASSQPGDVRTPQLLLGHATSRTTEYYYLGETLKVRTQAVQALEARLVGLPDSKLAGKLADGSAREKDTD